MNYLQKIISIFVFSSVLPFGIVSAEDLIHIVGRGETVYSISRFYSVTPDELMRLNGINDPSKLQVGKRLTIPSSADIQSVQSAVSTPFVNYRVVRGDTLFSIARTHKITLANLQELNNFSTNHVIKAGDVIKVPGGNDNIRTNPVQIQPPANNPAALNSGILTLIWPVKAKEITYMTGQMGVVVEGEHSEPVKSISQGKVISAGPWRKFGKVAIVEDAGGYLYMYGGCETLTVNVGDRISLGMELGRLGVNTVSEKPQLFFMVFRNEVPIDPAKAPRAASNSKT